MALRRRRRRWDAQPTEPVGVLLASDGREDFSSRAVAAAAALGAEGVAVVTIAKVHGFSLGIPHPGLLPTKAEAMARSGWVETAVDALIKRGVTADGQVATTRHATKMLAKIAVARNVRHVVVDDAPSTGLRRMIEGDAGSELKRRLRDRGVEVVIVPR